MNNKCFLCGTPKNLTIHHLFSQTKLNKKLYGELIHRPENLLIICLDCHLTKTLPKMTEIEFCKKLKIEVRSKTGKILQDRFIS